MRQLIIAELNNEEEEFEDPIVINTMIGRVDQYLQEKLALKPNKMIKLGSNLIKIAAAAVIFIILSCSIYYYLYRSIEKLKSDTATHLNKKDIAPGRNQATLTLADGRQIILTDATEGELARQAGFKITKTKNGQLTYQVTQVSGKDDTSSLNTYNTISTPRGGQYRVNLPDGSKVWLNAASSIKFSAAFNSRNVRKIELTGEAYFEVARLKTKTHSSAANESGSSIPFIVVTGKQEVRVLGTHFNINAYNDEPVTKTTLLEGSVRITGLKNKETVKLKEGEQSGLNNYGIAVSNVNTEQFIAWKNNTFMFEGDNIQAIMRQISRWYNVEVIFKGNISKENFGGKISRLKNLSEILDLIELTGLVHFNVEGRRIIVMP
ncbi:hypothetical protein DBR43_27170 [Pedobacter sp. KBW06]|nr:hypothetical protein DBR43_27170 [Pedobacter sp. KBW06]